MEYNDTPPEELGLVSPCCGSDYGRRDMGGINTCEKCKNRFDEPEDESEYNERMRENALEEKADAKRKYNE